MSLLFFPMSIGFMSHVNFKKWPCRPVDFKGQGPLQGSKSLLSCNGLRQLLFSAVSCGPNVRIYSKHR